MEWQPIETAPKDGTMVDLYRPPAKAPFFQQCRVSGWWDREKQMWIWPTDDRMCPYVGQCIDDEDSDCYESDEFTHWMPLPPPPKDAV